jgi:hypothetical protein
MAYFLGRDVDIAISTEHPTQGVVVKVFDADATGGSHTGPTDKLLAGVMDFAQGSTTCPYTTANKTYVFAGPKAFSTGLGCDTNGAFGTLDGDGAILSNQQWDNQPNNLTALDVSLGVQDEDVAFIGQRNILKAEVKKENTLSLTRKKSDAMWDAIYNDARFGIKESNTVAEPTVATPLPGVFTGLSAPDFIGCGYRVVVRFNEKVPIADTTLTDSLSAEQTFCTVTSVTNLAALDYIKIEEEIVKITAINVGTKTLTITRAARGTTAATHANSLTISLLSTGGEGEVLVFRNCYVTEHSVSLQVDGSQEETLTLMSYTDPKIYDGITGGEWDDPTDVSEL